MKQERRRPDMPTDQASSQSDGDGWMEAWISCALHVRQQEVKEKAFTPTNEISHGSDNDRGGDGNDSSDNGHDPPGRWCRSRPGEHDAQALSPSRREAGGRPVPPLPSVARPWTACTRSRKDRRKISPARPHSAAGVMGRRSGGGTQFTGTGKMWSREISDRTAPPRRPTSAPGGGKPLSGPGGGWYTRPSGASGRASGGGVWQTTCRRGHRGANRDRQVRVLASWSYEASKRNGRNGSAASARQILVKVPCVSTNSDRKSTGAKSTMRRGGVPYRLAWNDEVRKGTDATGVRSTAVQSSEISSAMEADARSLGLNDGATATAPAAAAAAKRQGRPKAAAGAGLMVQLPRPTVGDEVSSTTPGGDVALGPGNSGFGCSLLSTSDSEWGQQHHHHHHHHHHQQQQQPVLEANRPSTSRVIANLRASVACDAPPSSASFCNSSLFSAAPGLSVGLSGSGTAPAANLEEMRRGASRAVFSPDVGPYDGLEHDEARQKDRPRPRSAAASSAAGRSCLSAGGAGVAGRHHGATTTSTGTRVVTNLSLFEDGANSGNKAVAATRRQRSEGKRGGTASRVGNNQQQDNNSRRPRSATGTISNRRGRAMKAATDYSFFPSPPPAALSIADERHPPLAGGHAHPLLWSGGSPKGDVSEWEGPPSLCSDATDEARSTAGYALDSPGTWREAVGY